MPITLPSFVAPNELIQSAWGNSVVAAFSEVDSEKMDKTGGAFSGAVSGITPVSTNHLATKGYVDTGDALQVLKAGDVMSGQLRINSADLWIDGGQGRFGLTTGSPVQLVDIDGGHGVSLGFHGAASSISSIGTRTGLVGHVGDVHMEVRSEATASDVRLRAVRNIIFLPADTESFRVVGPAFLFGKTAGSLDDPGVEIYGTGSANLGSVRSTTSAASIQNVYCRHMSSADADGESFAQFARTSSGTVIGSINQNSTTGVNFNTTSDQRLKTDVGLAAGDGLDTLLQVLIHRYQHVDDQGTTQLGVFAQELVDIIPQAVQVGGDDVESDPWQVGYGNQNIVGHLILAVQQLAERVAALEAT